MATIIILRYGVLLTHIHTYGAYYSTITTVRRVRRTKYNYRPDPGHGGNFGENKR